MRTAFPWPKHPHSGNESPASGRSLLPAVAFFLFLLPFPAAAAEPPGTVVMTVHAQVPGNGFPEGATRFLILPSAGDDATAERSLAGNAVRILENRGYFRDETRPEITLDVSYECLPVRIETAAGAGGALQDERLYIKGSFTETRFSRKVVICVFRSGSETGMPLLWRGEVESGGSCGETIQDAPLLLDELLGEFPRPTGRPAERVRRREETP